MSAGAPRPDQSLQRELEETRERLHSIIEKYENALEQLKSSNEKLVSVNEELQSTNEELEVSKEELQSVNAELHQVNIDLNGKIEALDQANSDLQNLFDSTNVATVFLDRDLVIRSFTPAVARLFEMLPAHRGRPVSDLSRQLDLPGLADDIGQVLARQTSLERRMTSQDGQAHYLVRLGPYQNVDRKTVGVVITFVDVTTLTRAEAHQQVLLAEVQHRTRNLLAIVQSIARQTLGKGGSVEEFLIRLAALGRVQGLISHSAADEIELSEIVRMELEAHGVDIGGHVTVAGPPVRLGLEHLQVFALALHELATNAVKHGALHCQEGRLAIAWAVEPEAPEAPLLRLTWRERGVAMPAGPVRFGYGRRLIEQALTFSLNARTDLVFGDDGIDCEIEIPLPRRHARLAARAAQDVR